MTGILLYIFLLGFSYSDFSQEGLLSFTKKADTFLKGHVKEGKVDYQKVLKNNQEIESLIRGIANQDLDSVSILERKAFYLNAYNLLVIYQLSRQMPVKDKWYEKDFFDKIKHSVAGEKVSLDMLQKEKLFSIDNDERLHFALVCGAKGCPPLRSEAYNWKNLESQLNDQVNKALNNPAFIRVDHKNKKTEVSEIFKWYEKDFLRKEKNIIGYINKYKNEKIPSNYKLTYYPYDWRINNI